MIHWLQHFFGFAAGDGNSATYLFWSGAGSDLAYLTFFAAAIGLYRKHNCQMRWCLRIGRYPLANPDTGIARQLCARHHPDVHHKALTAAHLREIQERRHLYAGRRPGRG